MATYYFHLRRDGREEEVVEADLPDLKAVCAEAALLMGLDLREQPAEIWDDKEWYVEARDLAGRAICRLTSMTTAFAAMPPRTVR